MKENAITPSIERFRVPFSIKDLWREGCDGDTWWFERYGEEFSLLVSESGEAYVCPSDLRRGWRIYSNPCGRAFKFKGWPAGGRSYEREDATDDMGRILACALMTIDDIAPVICNVATGKGVVEAPRPSLALGGMDVPLGDEGWRKWRLRLDSGEVRVLCQDREIAVDAVPVVVERFDGARRIASVSEVGHALRFLEVGGRDLGPVQKAAIEIAEAAFKRAWETMQAIERFENECRNWN